MVPDRVSQLFLMFLLNQHYVEIDILCDSVPPTVSERNKTVVNTHPRSVRIYQTVGADRKQQSSHHNNVMS